MGVATYGTYAPLPVGVHRHNRTPPHLNTASAVAEVEAKYEMCTFKNQNGVWAAFPLLHGVC